MTQQEQIYGPYIGTIGQTEEQTPDGKAAYYRIELIGPEGRGQWFSAFGNVPKIMLSQPGATWACTYTVWTGTNGNQRYTIKDAQTSGSGPVEQAPVQQAPVQHMPVDQTPMPQAQPPQAQQASSIPAWSLNLDDRGKAIIRQVAFKEISDKDGKSGEQLNELTDLYESIILAAYQPVPDAPLDDGFIQHEL
jgi:hypothetical protein